jgi:hypothetical protein
MEAIKNHHVSLREVSRVLEKPLHTAGQWYRSQLLEELRSRLTRKQQTKPEESLRRGEITAQELQILLDAKLKSLKHLLWTEENRERYRKSRREYGAKRFKEDPEFRHRQLAASTRWRKANRKKFNRSRKNWLDKDVSARLADRIRSRIRTALRAQRTRKVGKVAYLIGCSIEELRHYLAARFQLGMSWDNYGVWHVDHIIPCAAFDLSQAEDQKKCFHFTNLQPLWGSENIRKGKK